MYPKPSLGTGSNLNFYHTGCGADAEGRVPGQISMEVPKKSAVIPALRKSGVF